MKRDLENRADIELLVDTFYQRVRADKLLGPIFNDVVHVNWERHLPLMYDFWSSLIFYTEQYEGNPMVMHGHLSKITPLTRRHFKRWTSLFNATVDDLFAGEKANWAKLKGRRIADALQEQILNRTSK